MADFLDPDRAYRWVGALSERRAALAPGDEAVVDRTTGERITYGDLDARASRAARLLAERGVDAGDRVAVVSRNRPEFVALLFGAAKVGAVLAPLSHRLAPAELAALLNDVEPALLVVEEPFDDLAGDVLDREDRAFDPEVLSLATDGDHRWTAYGAALPRDGSAVDPGDSPDEGGRAMGDPWLLLHTGGSTGTPKETVVTYGGVLWNSVNTITAWGLRDDDVTPLTFPMFHTGGWNVLTLPLLHMGATVVLARGFDAGDVLRTVEDEGATVLVAVPAMYRMMVEADGWEAADLSTLRFAKSGGGPARRAVMEAWWDRGIDLSQGYGLTECGPNNFAMPDGWDREKADRVGVPAPHVDARVVDDEGTPVARGATGELELAGPHAADRYWRTPGETDATFGGGWISTGDLARIDPDGYYAIEGRVKNMFVSGGENVYPPEVEDAVTDHPAVAECVVVPVDDERWGQVGHAVVVLADDRETEGDDESLAPDDDESLAPDDLRSFLGDRLARFKHPRYLTVVEDLPTAGPSKIDRDAVEAEHGGEPP